MMGRMHLALGICAGAAAGHAAGGAKGAVIGAAACGLGELLPDIDTPDSMLGHLLGPVAAAIGKAFGHRGFMHSPVALALAVLASRLLKAPAPMPGMLALGFFLHLVQDSLTAGGVPWLWPLPLKLSLCRIRTGSIWEVFITIVLFAAVLGVLGIAR